MMADKKGKPLAELQERSSKPENKWEKGTVLGPELGLGEGLDAREKVDVPIETPDDMDAESGLRAEYLHDIHCLPLPVILVTTVDLKGNVDCSPKNWCTVAGSHGFAFVCNTEHDCYQNIQTTGEFVVNVPGVDLVDKLHTLARKGAPSWENELKRAGLTEISSTKVKPPRVKECRVHMECRAEWLHEVDSAMDLKSATPPPGTMPSWTAARVAWSASSTRAFFSFISSSEAAPTRTTATPPASFASRSSSFSRS